MAPNVAALRLPLGARKLVWLSRLKASRRNSNCAVPARAKRFEAARSNCQKFGPRTRLRAALPNGWLGSVGIDTHAALNQLPNPRLSDAVSGSHVTLGR